MEPRIVTKDLLIDPSFLFKNSKDAIFIFDKNAILDANQSAIALLGLQESDELWEDGVFRLIKDQKGNEYNLDEFTDQLYKLPHQAIIFQFITKFAFFWVEISNTIYDKDGKQLIFSIWRDITETKQLESSYHDREKKLTEALTLTKCATWEYDRVNNSFLLSGSLVDLLGLQDLFADVEDQVYAITVDKYIDLIFEEDQLSFVENRKKIIASAAKDDSINHQEYRVVRPDGEVRNIYSTTRSIYEEEGNYIKYYGTIQDVTEIHHIEGELTKSKEQLSDALSIANLSTWELDMKNSKMKVGSNFMKLIGSNLTMDADNIVDVDSFIGLIHPDDLHTYYIALDRAVKAREPDYIDFTEYRIVRPDGEVRNIYISIKVRKDKYGNHYRHFGTIQDITPIRKAIAEKERYGNIIEATSDIVLIINKDMNLIYLNQAARDFYGFSPEDNIVGFPVKILQSDHSLKLTKEMAMPIAAERGIWSGENVIQRYDKELIKVSQVILSHKGVDGEVEYYSSIIRDISELKQIEEDLKYKNKELDTFVYKASHDLRGPIASLMGLFKIIENEITDPQSMEYFNLYNKQITRLNDIILNLIQLTKIKEVDVVKQKIDFEETIESCIGSFTNLPNFENVSFNINLELDKPFISDRTLVNTIMQNLIENAIKYSKPGQKSEVQLEIKRNINDDLIIRIEDQGIGIEESIQGEVFNMFFRASNEVIGSGLGLYILKNAVEKLNGKVSLFSKVNEGTTFMIKLKQD